MAWIRRTWPMVTLGLLAVLVAGCATDGPGVHRLARYRPDGAGRKPWTWVDVAPAGNGPEVEPPEGAADVPGGNGDGTASTGVVLSRGDHVWVYLRSIPHPEEIEEVIDPLGQISLPLIGEVRVAELSTSEAERAIKAAYVDDGYYRKIDVAVVTEKGEYYVSGEVMRVGTHKIAGDLTLQMAITAAGGFTDFAQRRKVRVRRGQEDTVYNMARIQDGKDPDPLIMADDIINVPRRLF